MCYEQICLNLIIDTVIKASRNTYFGQLSFDVAYLRNEQAKKLTLYLIESTFCNLFDNTVFPEL